MRGSVGRKKTRHVVVIPARANFARLNSDGHVLMATSRNGVILMVIDNYCRPGKWRAPGFPPLIVCQRRTSPSSRGVGPYIARNRH